MGRAYGTHLYKPHLSRDLVAVTKVCIWLREEKSSLLERKLETHSQLPCVLAGQTSQKASVPKESYFHSRVATRRPSDAALFIHVEDTEASYRHSLHLEVYIDIASCLPHKPKDF